MSVQAKVLELFQELQREIGFACLFISHDLAVVEILSQRIAVHAERQAGRESGSRDEILRDPQDIYTRRLLAAVPVPDPDEQRQRRTARDELLAVSRGRRSRHRRCKVRTPDESMWDRRGPDGEAPGAPEL